MDKQLLNYFGRSHADYLHARGKLASNRMIELLDPKPKEVILELGFGTGSTLVQLASKSRDVELVGYEASPLMFKKASQRIRFCRLSHRINLALLKDKRKLPAADNTFDKVYAESILGIQEGNDFKKVLLEIRRVLKPNGVLLFNETIWIETTTNETAQRINEACKKRFGIIQASHEYTHLKNWKTLLAEIGFDCEFEESVSKMPNVNLQPSPVLTKIYTLYGKVVSRVSMTMRNEWTYFQKEMSCVIPENQKLMEGIIVKLSNKK